jgi:hypothetical protein
MNRNYPTKRLKTVDYTSLTRVHATDCSELVSVCLKQGGVSVPAYSGDFGSDKNTFQISANDYGRRVEYRRESHAKAQSAYQVRRVRGLE